jgi:hypothetical protein
MRAVSAALSSLIPAGILNWVKEIILGAPRPVPIPVPVRANRPHGQGRRARR